MGDAPDKKGGSGKPHYLGHRGRLRERFMRDLGASMEDYEILELLLTMAIPRADTRAGHYGCGRR